MSTDSVLSTLGSLLGLCPTLLVLIVGLVVAIARWNQHPRVSMYVATGVVITVVASIGSRAFFALVPRLADSGEGLGMSARFALVGGVSSLVHSVGLGLFIAAALVDRAPTRERS